MADFLLLLHKAAGVSDGKFSEFVTGQYVRELAGAVPGARFDRLNVVEPGGTVQVEHIKDVPPSPTYDGILEGHVERDEDLAGLAEGLRKMAASSAGGAVDQGRNVLVVVENHRSQSHELGASAGAPDDGSMIKQVVFLRKKDGMSRQDFIDYYETRHAKLAVELVPSFARYERDFVDHEKTRSLGVGASDPILQRFDVMTTLWFRDRDGQRILVEKMADPKIAKLIASDEENLFDRTAIQMFLVEEHVLTGEGASRAVSTAH